MVGCGLLRVIRDQGISWGAGLGMTMYPRVPAAFKAFQRSSIEEKVAESGPGMSAGEPETYTTILRVRSRPERSSRFFSAIFKPLPTNTSGAVIFSGPRSPRVLK